MMQHQAIPLKKTGAQTGARSPNTRDKSPEGGLALMTKKLTPAQRSEIRALDNSEKIRLINKIESALKLTTINAISKSEALRPRIHISSDSDSYILIDNGVVNSTMCSYLGAIFECISEETGAPIKVVSDASYEFVDDKQVDDFLIGFVQGIKSDSKYRPKLRTDKKPMDLGKATAFFLRLRGEVLKGGYSQVTLEGLKTFHAFLGNDPSRAEGEEKRARISPLFKTLQSMFLQVPSYQSRYKDYYDLIVTSLAHIGLKNFTEEEVIDTIKHYMKSYDDIVHDFDQVAYSVDRKGKKKVVGTRRPRKPNPSPTLMGFEFTDFVDKVIGAHWQTLEDLKKDFKNLVITHGYKQIYAQIRHEYQARFETIRNFSNLTTKRLQEARSAGLLQPNSKKTDFTDAVRTDFFNHRAPDQRVDIFYLELKRLIPAESRYSTLTRFLKSISMSPVEGSHEEIDKRMTYAIAVAYAKHSINTGNFQRSIPQSDATRGKRASELLSAFADMVSLRRELNLRFSNLKMLALKKKEIVLRQKGYLILKGQLEKFSVLADKFSWSDKEAVELWDAFYSQVTGINTPSRYIECIREEVKIHLKTLKEGSSKYSIVFQAADDKKQLLEDLDKKFQELKI